MNFLRNSKVLHIKFLSFSPSLREIWCVIFGKHIEYTDPCFGHSLICTKCTSYASYKDSVKFEIPQNLHFSLTISAQIALWKLCIFVKIIYKVHKSGCKRKYVCFRFDTFLKIGSVVGIFFLFWCINFFLTVYNSEYLLHLNYGRSVFFFLFSFFFLFFFKYVLFQQRFKGFAVMILKSKLLYYLWLHRH